MHQYFCVLNEQQGNYLFELYGVSNDELDIKVLIEVEDYQSDIQIAFSQDDTVFAIRIYEDLYGYKKQNNNFIQFLKMKAPEDSIIHIIKNNTRMLILDFCLIMIFEIDINQCIQNKEFNTNHFYQSVTLLREHCFFDYDGSIKYTIHFSEQKILQFINNKEPNILIIDLFENILSFEKFDENNEFCFSQNGNYFAKLKDQKNNKELTIFKVQNKSFLKQSNIFQQEIQGDSIQFLDDDTKNIFNVKEGIIIKEQKKLALYNFIEDNLIINFNFNKSINQFQIQGSICLISSEDSCQIFKISKQQELTLLYDLPSYKGQLLNNNYIQFQQLSNFPITQPQVNGKYQQSNQENDKNKQSKLENNKNELSNSLYSKNQQSNYVNNESLQEIDDKQFQEKIQSQIQDLNQSEDLQNQLEMLQYQIKVQNKQIEEIQPKIVNQIKDQLLHSENDDDQQKSKTIIIHLKNLPNFVYKHKKIIKYQQILSKENKIALIDEENNLNIFNIENYQENPSYQKIQEKVIQFDNENYFYVQENQDQISIYQKTDSLSYKKGNQFQIPNLEQSNLIFSSNGNHLLKQRQNFIDIINLQSQQVIVQSQSLQEIIGLELFAIFPDGSSFAIGQSDGSINLYKYCQSDFYHDSKLLSNQQNIKSFICYKSFAIYQNIQSKGCLLNANSKIISSNKKDLKELFISRGAKEVNFENECNLSSNKNQKQNLKFQVDLLEMLRSEEVKKKCN